MKKEFFTFLWNVIDKFGYPVFGAFILSIVVLVIAPDKYIDIVPFPENKIYWACAILVVAFTLIIAFMKYLWSFLSERRYRKICRREMDKKKEKEAIYSLWKSVDAFSENDRADIEKFLETDNKPIAKYGYSFPYDSLYRSDWIMSIEKKTTEEYVDTNYATGKKEVFTRICTHMYKLNPDIYQALKYSKEKYGRISNFDK